VKLLKILISEISEKLKKQLIIKFSGQTSDNQDIIASKIDAFEKYKNGLPADKRDINKYSYEELSSLITSKETKKGLEDIFTEFKKKEEKLDRVLLKKYIKKFLEIQSELPTSKQDILKFSFLNLVKFVDDVYVKIIRKKIFEKFKKENPNLTDDQILFYIETYIENFDTIPFETKGIDKMSFVELEQLLDSLNLSKDSEKASNKKDLTDIEMIYDENNLKVFAPKTKDQCIKLRNGRSWCTSRSGSGNMYYNYRLGHERTLYYVIDEDKDFSDLNFAVVVLVDPDGDMALADGSNSGRYSGHSNIPWSEIETKIPKLKGLKNLFEPKPLTQEEKNLIRKVERVRVGENPMDSFDNEQEVEMWLEYNSPRLSDIQYGHLSIELKKKYISLGMDLSSGMIKNSEPEVLKYYISKKIDKIKETSIDNLSSEDISLLNTPMLKKIKEELRTKFATDLTGLGNSKKIEIDYPSGKASKFVALYGFDSLFSSVPSDIKNFLFNNKSQSDMNLVVPETISRFKELEALLLMKCVSEIPESIGKLKNLSFLSLPDNPNLKKIPSSILTLPNLMFINLKGSNPELPEGFNDKFVEEGQGTGFFTKKF